MTTFSLQEAQAKLPEIIRQLSPGKEVLITENDRTVARLSIASDIVELATEKVSRDWWAALQKVQLDQQARGFVGTVSYFDRDDQGYEERMSEIFRNSSFKDTDR